MLFLWTITKYGKIWIDGDVLRQLVTSRLPSDFHCQEVSFIGDQNLLNIYITMPERDDPQKRLELTDQFEEFFRPAGIAINIHWTQASPDEYPAATPIWKKPLFWAAAAGGVAAVANLGIWGILWVAGSAAAACVISWVVFSEEGKKLVSKFVSDIKDFRR
jgi:hypothetical protein